MKKILSCSIFLCCIKISFSQVNINDINNLHHNLQSANTDSAKIWALHNLAFFYMYTNPDSCFFYAQQALDLSKKTHYERGEIRSMNDIGNTLSNTGNFAGALDIFIDALQKAEKTKDENMQATTLGNISETYKGEGDYQQAINYTHRSLAIDLKNQDSIYLVYDYLNLGDYYEKNNQADSALIYENQAYQLNLYAKQINLNEGILLSLGQIQARIGNDDIALPYYNKSIIAAQATGNIISLSRAFLSTAELYKRAGKTDSAILYLMKAYSTAQRISFQEGILTASTALASIYENSNNDSTLKYLKVSVAIKDSIFSQEKIKQVQSLTFTEQLRQTEELARQNEDQVKHRQNIESAAIGIGIITFIILFLMYSRSVIASPRLINFLGILALLVTFEFLYLLLDRFIEAYTHESTLWMLLLWVVLGAILAPLDHFIEHWIKHKLVEKNKLIKIAAAHKMLEKLEEKKD